MKQTVTTSEFTAAFHNANRGDNFSHAGLCALYDYLTELESDTGEEYELDVIALCCDFTEYSVAELREQWPELSAEAGDDDAAMLEAVEEHVGHFIAVDNEAVIVSQ